MQKLMIDEKKCNECRTIKSLDLFYKNRSTKDGKAVYCKECQKKHQKKYNRTEKGRSTSKKYMESDKGKMVDKKYRDSGKGKVAIKRYNQSEKGKKCANKYNKIYRRTEEGKEAARRSDSKYKLTKNSKKVNKKAHKKYDRSRKGRLVKKAVHFKRKGKSYISKEILEEVLLIYGAHCIYCGNDLFFETKDPHFKLTFDHLESIAKGGTNDLSNLVPACLFHNSQKGKKDFRHYVKTYFPDSIDEIFEKLSLGRLVTNRTLDPRS